MYLVSCSQQVISHLVQVGLLACEDEARHLFEDIWPRVIYLHTVLNRWRGQERRVGAGLTTVRSKIKRLKF